MLPVFLEGGGKPPAKSLLATDSAAPSRACVWAEDWRRASHPGLFGVEGTDFRTGLCFGSCGFPWITQTTSSLGFLY